MKNPKRLTRGQRSILSSLGFPKEMVDDTMFIKETLGEYFFYSVRLGKQWVVSKTARALSSEERVNFGACGKLPMAEHILIDQTSEGYHLFAYGTSVAVGYCYLSIRNVEYNKIMCKGD